MKRLITIVMALILALSLASFPACGPEEEGPAGEVKITFMHMWPEHEAVMNQLLDQFEAENEGITVEASITPYDQIEQVLQAAQISGTLPNVYTFYTHYMTPMVSSTDGVMAGSLNELHDEIIGDFIQESSWELGKINGTYYSAPFRATGELIFYNKTLFGEKGWNKPETFEAFEALLDAVSADGTYTPLAAGGKEHQITYLINAMSLFCSVMDGSVDEPGYAVGRLEPDESDNTSVLIYEKVHDWYAADYFGKGAIAVSKQGAIKEFTSRRAAMVFANVNNLGDIATLMPNDEIGVFAIPAPSAIAEDVKYVYGGYDGLSYNPGASEAKKEASLKLIKFLVSAEVQQILADRTQSIVVNKNAEYHSEMYKAFAEEYRYVGAYATGTDYVTGQNAAGNVSIMSTYISGTSGQSAAQIIRLINDNVWKDMQDPLLNNPVKDWYPRQNPRKDFDKSWLN